MRRVRMRCTIRLVGFVDADLVANVACYLGYIASSQVYSDSMAFAVVRVNSVVVT